MSRQRDQHNRIRSQADQAPLPTGGSQPIQVSAPGGGGGGSSSVTVSIAGEYAVGVAMVCVSGSWQVATPEVSGVGLVGVVTASADDLTTVQVGGTYDGSGTAGAVYYAGDDGALTTTRPDYPDVARVVAIQIDSDRRLLPAIPIPFIFAQVQACIDDELTPLTILATE